MANHKEILRLKSLGLTHAQIALSCECGRNTVTRPLQQAQSAGLSWSQARNMTEEEITAKLYPKAPYCVRRRGTTAGPQKSDTLTA